MEISIYRSLNTHVRVRCFELTTIGTEFDALDQSATAPHHNFPNILKKLQQIMNWMINKIKHLEIILNNVPEQIKLKKARLMLFGDACPFIDKIMNQQ